MMQKVQPAQRLRIYLHIRKICHKYLAVYEEYAGRHKTNLSLQIFDQDEKKFRS